MPVSTVKTRSEPLDLNLETPRNHLFIRSTGAEGIRVGDDYYNSPFILSGQQVVAEWNVNSISDISESTLQVIFDMQPELVLIGCGKTQAFLPPVTQALFLRHNVGVEVMVTDAACRTFNVLAADGRHVVAALIPG